MSRQSITASDIDTLLPQTQCGLCGYGGCMPYAEALIHENAPINLCPPGGVKGLKAIAALLKEDATPYIEDMEKNALPKLLAIIRESECIGCTKCIQACPVDAIVGGPKLMHTIITAECTGCELCLPPCPVDCIDVIAIPEKSDREEKEKANHARTRYRQKQSRLANNQTLSSTENTSINAESKKILIQEAILRAKLKKQQA
jgi:electron transport complex protein RnfB